MAVKTTKQVRHNGKQYAAGAVITKITNQQANQLVSVGAAEYVSAADATSKQGVEARKQTPEQEQEPTRAELEEQAKQLGVEAPEKFRNKAQVQKAIDEAKQTVDKDVETVENDKEETKSEASEVE